MKTVGVVLVLMLVVAGIAVEGSRAQMIPATSVAFDQCQRDGGAGGSPCAPLAARMTMEPGEGDVDARGLGGVGANEAGADVSPDHSFQEHAVAVVEAVVGAVLKELYDHFFGNGLPIMPDIPVASTVFDPAK